MPRVATRLTALAFAALLASPVASLAQRGGPPPPADQARPRTDQQSRLAHQELLEKKTAGTIDVWADAVKPILTELLGPPAKEDHAPPPTGVPGR